MMQARLLLLLLFAVVACLADAMQVALIPELALIAAMRVDVIAYQFGCLRFDASASGHLASEQIALKDHPSQFLPT